MLDGGMLMSKFIRVYLNNNTTLIMKKSKVIISKNDENCCLVTGFPKANISGYQISEEEYSRLCTELGVE
jgi:hypothetical protein